MTSTPCLLRTLLAACCTLLTFAAIGCSGDPSKLIVDGVIAHRGRDGGPERSQIIAAIDTSDPATVARLADSLAEHYGYDRVAVNFYDDVEIVSRFNGSGKMLDEKSWIAEVTIDRFRGGVHSKSSPSTD